MTPICAWNDRACVARRPGRANIGEIILVPGSRGDLLEALTAACAVFEVLGRRGARFPTAGGEPFELIVGQASAHRQLLPDFFHLRLHVTEPSDQSALGEEYGVAANAQPLCDLVRGDTLERVQLECLQRDRLHLLSQLGDAGFEHRLPPFLLPGLAHAVIIRQVVE